MSDYDMMGLDSILSEMKLAPEDKLAIALRDACAAHCRKEGSISPRDAGAALGTLFSYLLIHTDERGQKRAQAAFKDAMTAGLYVTCGMDSIAVH